MGRKVDKAKRRSRPPLLGIVPRLRLRTLDVLRPLRRAKVADAARPPKRAHKHAQTRELGRKISSYLTAPERKRRTCARHLRERGGRARTKRLALLGATVAVLTTVPVNAAVVQQGNLRITLLSQVQPYKLPRIGTSPIAVFIAGRIASPKGGVPAQLQRMSIKVNRHAHFQSRGLPACPLKRIQPATTTAALKRCGPSVVGSGQFWAQIVFPEQGSYPTQGRLLVFNGRRGGREALFAHIYTDSPFSTSFVIPFAIRKIDSGPYGTELTASLPEALGNWGFVDRIKLTLKRKYRYRGQELSYFNAGCPAVAGASRASFHLAFATFAFEGAKVGLQVDKSCGVKE